MATIEERLKELEERGSSLTRQQTIYSDTVHNWIQEVGKLRQEITKEANKGNGFEKLVIWAPPDNHDQIKEHLRLQQSNLGVIIFE